MKVSSRALVGRLRYLTILEGGYTRTTELCGAGFCPPTEFGSRFFHSGPAVGGSALFTCVLVLLGELPRGSVEGTLVGSIGAVMRRCGGSVSLSLVKFPRGCGRMLGGRVGA